MLAQSQREAVGQFKNKNCFEINWKSIVEANCMLACFMHTCSCPWIVVCHRLCILLFFNGG